MKAFISADKNLYYEAPDRLSPNDMEVPNRPTPDHIFVNGMWIDKNHLNAYNVNHHFPNSVAASQQQIPVPALPVQSLQPVSVAPAQTNLSDLVNVIRQLQNINNASTSHDPQQMPKKESPMGNFIGDKFTWKDLITILYFAGGIVGLWMHLNERIIVLEQKVVTIEKGNAELQSSFKEFTVENKNQLKNIDSKISDLQQMVISRISSRENK